jgi:23S rRNA pseudouridine2457 synthase
MKQRLFRYVLFNKPYGVLCAFRDDGASPGRAADGAPARARTDVRRTLADYLLPPGVEPAGRLDLDSEGLLLLTDDGDVLHRLAHPRYHQPKTYLVQVEAVPDQGALAALRQGVMIKGYRTAPAQVELLAAEPELAPRAVPVRPCSAPSAWLRIVLAEGRKRQIRHMTAAVGHPTLRLVRVAVGPLSLGDLPPGEWRDLTPEERDALRAAVGSARAMPG